MKWNARYKLESVDVRKDKEIKQCKLVVYSSGRNKSKISIILLYKRTCPYKGLSGSVDLLHFGVGLSCRGVDKGRQVIIGVAIDGVD